MPANVTRILAEFAADLSYGDLPEDVRDRAKTLILDVAGNIIRARHDAESTPALLRAIALMGLGQGNATVLGDARTYSPVAGAMINGTMAHSLDFDDTHAGGSIHSSAPIVPAALAAAELVGAEGDALIAAIVAGYEIQIRLSLALDPSAHYDQGFHPTATCGIFAATAAAGKLLGLDASGIESAFGIALSQAAGSMQFLSDGSWTKRSHVGQAAQNGLMAALLASEGFIGPKQAFEGRWGFLHSHAPNSDEAKAIAELGSRWVTMELALKPYPSCRYTHAAIDGLVTLKTDNGIAVDEIEKVVIGLPETGLKIVAIPLSDKQSPSSIVDGQFSMPFCAAVALREGSLKWDHYKTHLTDADTLALCKTIEVGPDGDAEAAFPRFMSGKAAIHARGKIFEKFVEVPLGEPENFLSQDAQVAKFASLAGPYMRDDAISKLPGIIFSLDQPGKLSSFLELAREVA